MFRQDGSGSPDGLIRSTYSCRHVTFSNHLVSRPILTGIKANHVFNRLAPISGLKNLIIFSGYVKGVKHLVNSRFRRATLYTPILERLELHLVDGIRSILVSALDI